MTTLIKSMSTTCVQFKIELLHNLNFKTLRSPELGEQTIKVNPTYLSTFVVSTFVDTCKPFERKQLCLGDSSLLFVHRILLHGVIYIRYYEPSCWQTQESTRVCVAVSMDWHRRMIIIIIITILVLLRQQLWAAANESAKMKRMRHERSRLFILHVIGLYIGLINRG